MIERRGSLKSLRGPLKAIGNIGHFEDHQNGNKYNQKRTTTLPNQFHCSDDLQTPVQRASNRSSQIRAPESMQNLLPIPLRTSSRRSENGFKCSNDSGISDIRHHFPVRGLTTKILSADQNQKLNQTNDSIINSNESSLSTDLSSFQSPHARKRHSTALDIHHEIKQSRLDLLDASPFQSMRTKPVPNCLTMGAGVKAHPRYYRRRSSASEILQSDENPSTLPSLTSTRLSPICPVPMPSGFPSRLPTCVSVSLPWDSATTTTATTGSSSRKSLGLKSAETQTSPLELQINGEKTRRRRHTGFGRQSSGTMQILQSIRKKFGHLRRAISADRLNRNSIDPAEFKSEIKSDTPPAGTIDTYSTPNSNITGLAQSHNLTKTTDSTDCRLTCQIKRRNSDGSVQILLRRSSTTEQFGFFIARDSHGIYVSRLGSVKCAAAVWNIFHVGDRILEVQGHKCTNLEVEDVRNLIRGCELVEFRIKSSNRLNCQRIPFR